MAKPRGLAHHFNPVTQVKRSVASIVGNTGRMVGLKNTRVVKAANSYSQRENTDAHRSIDRAVGEEGNRECVAPRGHHDSCVQPGQGRREEGAV